MARMASMLLRCFKSGDEMQNYDFKKVCLYEFGRQQKFAQKDVLKQLD
jgi:hypothetical protein